LYNYKDVAQIKFYFNANDQVCFTGFIAGTPEKADKPQTQYAQETLNSLGYDCGTPDGIVGQNTTAAIKRFQEDNGLFVSGVVDDELLKQLDKMTSSDDSTDETKTVIPKWVPPTDNTDSEISDNIPLATFVSRYNDFVAYLKQDQGVSISEVSTSTFENNDGVEPNNNLNFCVNPNTNIKDPVGIINIWGDATSIDSAKALGEVTAMFYAFDETLESPQAALDLFGELTDGEGRASHNGISYVNYTMAGVIAFKGEYDGFDIDSLG